MRGATSSALTLGGATGARLRRWQLARLTALALPAALLAGAYISELGFGLYPCEMCWWQRWPHFAAVGLAGAAFILPGARIWTLLAGLSILVSGAIGGFHAGVEYGWWQGVTGCAGVGGSGTNALEAVLSTPLIRCDQAPWSFLGVSLAGWNFLISTAGSLAVLWLLGRRSS